MMKIAKNTKLNLLVLASAALLVSCGNNVPASSVTSSVEVSEESSVQSQPTSDGDLVVDPVERNHAIGSKIDMRDYVKSTANGSFTLRSRNEEVAKICDDGYTIAIIGKGNAQVVVMSGLKYVTLNLRGMTAHELKAEAVISQIRGNYSMIGLLYETDSAFSSYDTAYAASIVCTPNYVFDGFYDSYSAVRLTKDGVTNNYAYTLLDEDGDKVYFPEYATQVSVTPETLSDAVIDSYFVHESDVVNISKFDDITTDEDLEDGLYCFETYDADLTLELCESLFSMYSETYSGVYSYLCIDTVNEVLAYQINMMYTYDSGYGYTDFGFESFVGTVKIHDTGIQVLDDYIASGIVPSYADTSDLKAGIHSVQNAKNYTVTTSSDVPDYDITNVEFDLTAKYTENAVLYIKHDTNTDAYMRFGFLNEDGKVYQVAYDEDTGAYVKGDAIDGYSDYHDYILTATWNDGANDFAYQGNIATFTDDIIDNGKFYQSFDTPAGTYLAQGKEDNDLAKTWMNFVMGTNPFTTYAGLPLTISYTEENGLSFASAVSVNFSSSLTSEWDFNASVSNVGTTTVEEFAAL